MRSTVSWIVAAALLCLPVWARAARPASQPAPVSTGALLDEPKPIDDLQVIAAGQNAPPTTNPLPGSVVTTRPVTDAELAKLRGRRVSVQLKDVMPQAAFETICAQAKVKMKFWADGGAWPKSPRVTLQQKDVPLMWALVQASEQANCRVQVKDDLVYVMPGRANDARECSSGAFLIGMDKLERPDPKLEMPDCPSPPLFTMLRVEAEPGLHVIARFDEVEPTEAADTRGLSILPPKIVAVPQLIGADETLWGLAAKAGRVNLAFPKELGARLKVMRGKLRMLVALEEKTFEVPNLTRARNIAAFDVGGATTEILQVKRVQDKDGVCYRIEVRGRALSSDYDRLHDCWDTLPIEVQDDRGRVMNLQREPSSWDDGTFRKVFVAFGNEATAGPPAKLVVRVPVVAKWVEIPYEFRNLTVPP